MKTQFLILPLSCALAFMPYSQAISAVRVSNNSVRGYAQPGYSASAVTITPKSTYAPQDAMMPEPMVEVPVESVIADTSDVPESCSMIYPNGEFTISRPTVGFKTMGQKQCTAYVELRGYKMGQNGTDLVLARSRLAAGDSFKCNIDAFPSADWVESAVSSVVFPFDNEPTVEDVEQVMNEEQKQDAGLKIAAAALIGGVGGNIIGKNDPGKDGLLGASKGKMKGTAIGALSGAAVMATSVYSGKAVGDTVLSAGVNAVAGGMVGNMAASGDSVMKIENCKLTSDSTTVNSKCLWGVVTKGETVTTSDYNAEKGETLWFTISDSKNGGENTWICTKDNICTQTWSLIDLRIEGYGDDETVAKIKEHDKKFNKATKENRACLYTDVKTKKTTLNKNTALCSGDDGEVAVKIKSAKKAIASYPVMIDLGSIQDKAFGWKKSDWMEMRGKLKSGHEIYTRDAYGNGTKPTDKDELAVYTLDNFYPMYIDADDGGIIDLGNKARMKSTLIGAGAGAALGGFVAYQGAQDEINERWVSAVREYKDSLQKFYCATGGRFLSYYNDMVVMPNEVSTTPDPE